MVVSEQTYFAQEVVDKNPMRLILLALVLLWGQSVTTFAQEKNIDSNILREIALGHQLLVQQTDCLSGTIESYNAHSETEELEYAAGRFFLFFRDKDLLRLEYINPRDGTGIFPGHKKNDITEVIVKSKDRNFNYWAISTTGVPYANLQRSTVLSEETKIILDTDFYSKINSLTVLDGSVTAKVTDMLQQEIGTIENRKYGDVPDALWIKGKESVDKAGNVSNWTFVLNTKQNYALLFYEIRVENPKTDYVVLITGTRSTQVTNDGKILPKEISYEGKTRVQVEGKKQVLHTGERTSVSVSSTAQPDSKLFTEEGFKDLGRDYAVVDVLPNRKEVPGEVVNAAPPEARASAYLIQKNPRLAWPWSRIVFLALSATMIVIACSLMYFKRKNSKDN